MERLGTTRIGTGFGLSLMVVATLGWTSCSSSEGTDAKGGPEDVADRSETLLADDLGADSAAPPDESPGEGTLGTYDMTGTWAEWEVGASITQVPVLGETHTLGVAIMRWEVTQDGEKLDMRQELCSLTLLSDSDLATTVVPDSFVRSVPLMDKTGTAAASETSRHFTMDLTPELYGVTLVDPLNDDLPTAADDPRVFDQDGDGHPGMTVFITGLLDGAAYVVQRNLRTLDGTFNGTDRIEGLLNWTQDQNIIDSDNEILAANHPSSTTDPDPGKSRFVAIRIPENRDCAWLVEHQGELFPQP